MPPETLPLAATCPRCRTEVGDGERCPACDLAFLRNGGILDVLGTKERERRAAGVEAFYTESPFPGYAASDDGPILMDRSRRSAFLAALDRAIPPDADVVDCGCGTGQTAAFLALAGPRRRVFGIDGCRRSLECADGFRTKVGLKNLQLVRADLFDLPARPGSFPVVVSRGVVHHTPDPAEAIRRVASLVAPGGTLVLGFYETWARLLHRARRGLSKLTGDPPAFLDPVLRRRDLDPEKKRIWIQDQYRHPLEHILPLPWVQGVLREAGLTWVRSVPPAPPAEGMFEPTAEPSRAARTSMRLGWMSRGLGDPDAGLVCVVARRGA